jgi:crotonobetainyl-CoA:carnitine CoA-transferase CaiB-like acyl-CoA transferase
LAARVTNETKCLAILHEALSTADAKTWEQRFADAGIPAAAVSTLPDVLDDKQLAHRNHIRNVVAPEVGDVAYCSTPFKISGEETGADRPPPLVGADTDAVLSECGFSTLEIASLREVSAI